MSFLNPALLLGLPLIVLPVAIHFWNRRRFRRMPWAATMFLREALRESRGRTRLRHFLVLACRVLALALLFLALAKPVVGGFAGRLFFGKPHGVTVIVLDRSPSMEAEMADVSGRTRRGAALKQLQTMCRQRGVDEVVLVESSGLAPVRLAASEDWTSRPERRPIDATSDVAAMLERALGEIDRFGSGGHELWLATDAQASAWQIDSPRWHALRSRVASMPSPPVLHRLTAGRAVTNNLAIRVGEARLVARPADTAALELRGRLIASESRRGDTVTVTLTMENREIDHAIRLIGETTDFKVVLENLDPDSGGWGTLRLPADGNQADNKAFFAFESVVDRRVLVVAENAWMGALLDAAVAPQSGEARSTEVVEATAVDERMLEVAVAVVWQGGAPGVEAASALRRFVERGGQIILFPSREKPNGEFLGMRWRVDEGEPPGARDFEPAPWRRDDGLLADTAGKELLPVDQLEIRRRAVLEGGPDAMVWAKFIDGKPLLISRRLGAGSVWACATLPDSDWSTLGDGVVLVPMMQRLVDLGMKGLGKVRYVDCGDALPQGKRLNDEEGRRREDGLRAGVFARGDGYEVFQRSAREDVRAHLPEETLVALFSGWRVSSESLRPTARGDAAFEWWTPFLLMILLALALESWLSMPRSRKPAASLR